MVLDFPFFEHLLNTHLLCARHCLSAKHGKSYPFLTTSLRVSTIMSPPIDSKGNRGTEKISKWPEIAHLVSTALSFRQRGL